AAEGLTAEGMQRLVDRLDGSRAILEQWIRRSMTPGLHYGIIPLDGQPPSKPTLLKPGAELIALLYGWKFHFVADLDSLQMYGPAAGAPSPTSVTSSMARGAPWARAAAWPSCASRRCSTPTRR